MVQIEIGPATLHRSIGGETLLINLDTGLCFSLDEVGDRIWQLILEHGEVSSIERQLEAEYEAESERIVRDLGQFLRELADKELITLG